jgi:cysteine desulfurase
MRTIYLDYNSSTPVAGSVREAMQPFLGDFFGDPASSHWLGRAAQEAIEDSRAVVSKLIGCHPTEMVFTSGGTESINLALLGSASQIDSQLPSNAPRHLIISSMEYSVVTQCAQHLQKLGWGLSIIGCDSHGMISLNELEAAIRPATRLVSIQHSNHQVGTIQPIAEIAELCHARDIIVHTDAAQSLGKIRTLVDELNVDLLSFSGHKMYAPKGIGGLYVRSGIPLQPIMFGEGNEGGLRPGARNVPHIVGLGQAARLVDAALQDGADRMVELRDRFLARLEFELNQPLTVHAKQSLRLPNTLSLELPHLRADQLLRQLPEICLGPVIDRDLPENGSSQNPTLRSIGLTAKQGQHTIRVSLGWQTTEEEVDRAAEMIAGAVDALHA